ncbi:DUF167 domain-containing protein [Candidatus Wolfebacteria bacterium]|nr:DUF167 domain-containing protein [Candidatus Wolfebacteria bacterium]
MKISIKVKPSAKIEKIEKIPELLIGKNEIDFKVWVKEPAKEGKANEAVIRALAKYFGVPKSAVNIISGAASKQKIIEIIK